MENQDRELILGLANRLRQAQPVQKDPEAAQLIAQYVQSQPDALYLLVQAVLVQEDALRTAQARITELQATPPAPAYGATAPAFGAAPAAYGTAAPAFGAPPAAYGTAAPAFGAPPAQAGGGGFMSRVFGQNRDQAPADAPQGRSGGGFLKTAAAAAAGVAGGALLFQGLNGAFGGHEATAGEHHGDPVGFDEHHGDPGDGEQW